MELTDTNEPCGLTISFFKQSYPAISIVTVFQIFGGHSEEVTPVPIPNTEVKLFSADGTAWETVWESRSPPVLLQAPPGSPSEGLLLLVSGGTGTTVQLVVLEKRLLQGRLGSETLLSDVDGKRKNKPPRRDNFYGSRAEKMIFFDSVFLTGQLSALATISSFVLASISPII